MERLKEILAFANNKGGVGKTTTVLNVAAGLLAQNPKLRILCIDLDSQCSLSSLLGWKDKKAKAQRVIDAEKDGAPFFALRTVADALRDADNSRLPVYKAREGLFYVPGSETLTEIDPDLHAQMQPKLVLRELCQTDLSYIDQLYPDIDPDLTHDEHIEYIEDDFDYVLIDCAPALSETVYNALGVATGLVIPVELSSLSVEGIGKMVNAYMKVKKKLNHDLTMRGLLIGMADERSNVSKETLQYIRDEYGDITFKTLIHLSSKIRESQYVPTDIFDYEGLPTASNKAERKAQIERKSRAYQDFWAFTEELRKTYNS
ncbi:MAG: ParA family protein [Prevotellaceae bacterium]|nr:ParA family protein [Prevotellaceae bacterium]